jgi:hypothetical protein
MNDLNELQNKFLHRYPKINIFSSSMPIEHDILNLIEGLTSRGVVGDILRECHGMSSNNQISISAKNVADFVRQALRFVEQARSGPSIVSYLPYYYAFLQFAKAVIVARRGSTALQSALSHGLSYRPTAKASHTLLTEQIHVRGDGVFPLFYEVLTEKALPDLRSRVRRHTSYPVMSITMRNIYPYLFDASFEFTSVSSQQQNYFSYVAITKTVDANSNQIFTLHISRESTNPNTNSSPLFRKLGVDSSPYKMGNSSSAYLKIPTYLLYQSITTRMIPFSVIPFFYSTPLWNGRLHYPEEIPLFLAFFHLGSIVRYKPQFMERMMDSAYYPFLLAIQTHCPIKICFLFYNLMMQCTYLAENP